MNSLHTGHCLPGSDEEASAVIQASMRVLGSSISLSHIDSAALGHFLSRFSTGTKSVERPWIELITAENTRGRRPRLAALALQANATALSANDLQRVELRTHATTLHLNALRQLQGLLKSPKWSHPDVLYTCMIMTLYEVGLQYSHCHESD